MEGHGPTNAANAETYTWNCCNQLSGGTDGGNPPSTGDIYSMGWSANPGGGGIAGLSGGIFKPGASFVDFGPMLGNTRDSGSKVSSSPNKSSGGGSGKSLEDCPDFAVCCCNCTTCKGLDCQAMLDHVTNMQSASNQLGWLGAGLSVVLGVVLACTGAGLVALAIGIAFGLAWAYFAEYQGAQQGEFNKMTQEEIDCYKCIAACLNSGVWDELGTAFASDVVGGLLGGTADDIFLSGRMPWARGYTKLRKAVKRSLHRNRKWVDGTRWLVDTGFEAGSEVAWSTNPWDDWC